MDVSCEPVAPGPYGIPRLRMGTGARPAVARMQLAASSPETTASSCSVRPEVHEPQKCVRCFP
eukprot:scaffold1456_cov68-Phaeocystis_antarctica.AAC.3